MARTFRVSRPPSIENQNLQRWLEHVADAINGFPPFSVISTNNGPENTIGGEAGSVAIDIGSSRTTFWAKESDDSVSAFSGWAGISLST